MSTIGKAENLSQRSVNCPRHCKRAIAILAAFVLWIANVPQMEAARVNGRVTVGGYSNIEEFTEDGTEGTTNDAGVGSGRFFMRATEITSKRLQFVVDGRAKYDLFGKVSPTEATLIEKGTTGIAQLAVKSGVQTGKFSFALGRFTAIDSGTIYVDGLDLSYEVSSGLSLGALGGLNPKPLGARRFGLNQDNKIYGGYLLYRDLSRSWTRSINATLAVISEGGKVSDEFDEETEEELQYDYERSYLYSNLFFQFKGAMRLMLLGYIDFAPEFDVQNLWVNWNHDVVRIFGYSLGYLEIHSNEYRAIEDTRLALEPSKYSQFDGKLKLKPSRAFNLDLAVKSGTRDLDGLAKDEKSLGARYLGLSRKRLELSLRLGTRTNFTREQQFGRVGVGYFRRKWELFVEQEVIQEKYQDEAGEELTDSPMITDASLSFIFSKRLFGTLGAQYIKDRKVTIISTLFRLAYRFGSGTVPPVRDGAPPKGRI